MDTLHSSSVNSNNGNSNIIHVIYIVVILLLIGGIGYLYYSLDKTTAKLSDCNTTTVEVSTERDDLISRLDSLEKKYIAMRDTNAAMTNKIDSLIMKIRYYRGQVFKNAKYKDSIDYYKAQIESQELVFLKYLAEKDSLMRANDVLKNANTQLITQVEEQKKLDEEKTKQLEDLTTKVEKASVLKAFEIIALPVNTKGKASFKSKKVDKIKVDFTIAENNVVEPGQKRVYLRITRGDGAVLTASQDNIFEYDGQKVLFTEMKDIDYQNQDVKTTIYYKENGDILSGTHKVTIICEGKEIGQTSFVLK